MKWVLYFNKTIVTQEEKKSCFKKNFNRTPQVLSINGSSLPLLENPSPIQLIKIPNVSF